MALRTRRIDLRLSCSEYELLKAKSDKAGISYSEFLRRCVASKEVKEAPPADVPELIMALRKSQLLLEKAIQSADTTPEEFLDVLRETREAEQSVARTYNMRN